MQTKLILKNEVQYQPDTIVSKQLIKSHAGNITIFAFSKGESISEHIAPFNSFITILEGEAKLFIDKEEYLLMEEESIIMPANIVHAIKADENFKMMLMMIKD